MLEPNQSNPVPVLLGTVKCRACTHTRREKGKCSGKSRTAARARASASPLKARCMPGAYLWSRRNCYRRPLPCCANINLTYAVEQKKVVKPNTQDDAAGGRQHHRIQLSNMQALDGLETSFSCTCAIEPTFRRLPQAPVMLIRDE